MADQYINMYKDNPTEGGIDGTVVSDANDMSNPAAVTLDASQNETKTVKLALRCAAHYKTTGNTVVEALGDTDDRWKFSLEENGTFEDAITIASSIDTVNTIFFARASSDSLETPIRDTSVKIKVSTTIEQI